MFAGSAELYDPLYGAFKDFASEATAVAQLIRQNNPSAQLVLDVGCGTAEHAKHLCQTFGFEVDGLDLDPGLLAVAKAKLPGARFFEADMSNFDLTQHYDVILCLFSSIGYVSTLERLTATLACFHRHLNPGGLAIIEPWFEPEALRQGHGTDRSAQIGEMSVTRKVFTRVEGRASTLEFTYIIEQRGKTRTVREEHDLGLFTQHEMQQCLVAAGLTFHYQQPGLTGRGVYLVRPAQ